VGELRLLGAGDAPALLTFEQANRGYFARSISDRGDAFFEHFDERFAAALAEQAAGACAFFVLVDEDGSVLGRFNLIDLHDSTPRLGYRVAEAVAGRGVATAMVEELCSLAASQYGLRTLRAAVSSTNPASQRVLAKAGFAAIRPADPSELGGKAGTRYERDLGPRGGI
jgi:ribosomal-protein-alanine N-acetyltransferase